MKDRRCSGLSSGLSSRLSGAMCVGLASLAVGAAGVGVLNFPGLGLIAPAQAASVTLADSVADFSGTQGTQPGQWQYGYYQTPNDANSFAPMSYDASNAIWEETPNRPASTYNGTDSWTMLNKTSGHPSSFPNGQRWAVRRWISNYAGSVTVSGVFGDINVQGNVLGRILLNGIQHQSFPSAVLGSDINYSFVATLAQGDRLDLALDPNGPDANDSATFTALIQTNPTAVPTPALLPGLMAFGAGMIKKRREQVASMT